MNKNQKKREESIVIINIVIVLIIILLCSLTYILTTKNLQNIKNKRSAEFSANIVNETTLESTDNLFTKENYPRVEGSIATLPLSTAFKRAFTGEKDVTAVHTNTYNSYIDLINGDADLILATYPSDEIDEVANEKNFELEITPVANEGLVFFTNSQNSVNSLTVNQIKDIYSGKITNWKDLGGDDAEIKLFQCEEGSEAQIAMNRIVMKGEKISNNNVNDVVFDSNTVHNVVQYFDNDKYSIGYGYYYYASTLFQDKDAESQFNIKLFNIDGIEFSKENIKNGTYPFKANYYIVNNKNLDEDSNVTKLKNAMLSDNGQKIVEEAGYIGLK